MNTLGLGFGSAAERYERYRAGYGEDVYAAVADYARRPIGTALEVGAGTGKATRLFAGHGVRVTALEPDARMAVVLAEVTRGLPVEPVVTTFEGFTTGERFDLVYAAASWHWTDPGTRWSRAVRLLVAGGTLALLGRPHDLKDPALYAAVDEIERRLLPDRARAVGHPWSTEQAGRSAGLTDVREQALPSASTVPAADFVNRLTTVSAYLALDPEERRRVLDAVRAVLPETVEVDTTTRLLLARRTDGA